MSARTAAATLLMAALLAGGCRKAEEGPAGPRTVEEIPGDEVRFLRTFPASPNGGFLAPERAVIRDAAAWTKAWARANAGSVPVPREPAVDFQKEMVALAALGQRRTAGCSVEIVGARKDGGKLRLLVAEREPPPNDSTAQVMSSPWHAVVLPASDLPIEWGKYEAPR